MPVGIMLLSWISKSQEVQSVGLNENVTSRPKYLNTWFPVPGAALATCCHLSPAIMDFASETMSPNTCSLKLKENTKAKQIDSVRQQEQQKP